MTTHSLVLETHNLEGGSGDVAAPLVRLLAHLAHQTYPVARLVDLVVTHRGLSKSDRKRCEEAVPTPITWVECTEQDGYYDAKNRGFDASRGDVVVFADGDCWPEATWLAELVAPFVDEATRVTAGRTTYRRDLLGTSASTLDFMYFMSPLGAQYTRNFYANNVAFRRDVFGTYRYGTHNYYRGHCAMLGLELHEARVPILFVPVARTIHRFPDSVRELIQLRLTRGRDMYELTPHLGRGLADGLHLPRLGPVVPLAVCAARLGFSLNAINRQDMPIARGFKKLAVAATTAAIAVFDAAGALAGGLGLLSADPHATLSYHGNSDGLEAAGDGLPSLTSARPKPVTPQHAKGTAHRSAQYVS